MVSQMDSPPWLLPGAVPLTAFLGDQRQRGRSHSYPRTPGPVDQMRQLVRILSKVLPQSDLGADTNRMHKDDIVEYLDKTLGEAPRPEWGLRDGGWQVYLATLYSWVAGKEITAAEVAGTIYRPVGCSYKVEGCIGGLHPATWRLPLTLEGVREGEITLVPQPVLERLPKKPKTKMPETSELELWKTAAATMNVLTQKAYTPSLLSVSDCNEIAKYKLGAMELIHSMVAPLIMPLPLPLPLPAPAPLPPVFMPVSVPPPLPAISCHRLLLPPLPPPPPCHRLLLPPTPRQC